MKSGQGTTPDDEEESNKSEVADDASSSNNTAGKTSCGSDPPAHSKKAIRLAMNRESARNRRRRYKIHMESLQAQVASLTASNRHYAQINITLMSKMRTLNSRLAIAENTISQLTMARSNNSTSMGTSSSAAVSNSDSEGAHHYRGLIGQSSRQTPSTMFTFSNAGVPYTQSTGVTNVDTGYNTEYIMQQHQQTQQPQPQQACFYSTERGVVPPNSNMTSFGVGGIPSLSPQDFGVSSLQPNTMPNTVRAIQ